MPPRTPPRPAELHVSRRARERYGFDQSLFALSGDVVFENPRAARDVAHRMNERRDAAAHPERAVRAGQINALGLIHEILHVVFRLYRAQRSPTALATVLDWLDARVGRDALDAALHRFADDFPPLVVYRGELDPTAYLAGATDGVPHRELLLEELVLLALANANPACAPLLELFDDAELERATAYPAIVAGLHEFFASQPPFGPDAEPLLVMLGRPAREVPQSLPGQLEYILKRWGYLLGPYLARLLRGLDLIREEEKPLLLGPGPSRVLEFGALALEQERYSPDRDWMPRLVLIARNAYVWLDQLSRRAQRAITRLDQIPDEELDVLARRGITGLWLIGLWERSRASRQIKQMMGNPEAVASAYSLFDYQIADDLGGQAALEQLRDRAMQRGIRLASDMVPNHMGIDSRWVFEHPDWFVQLDHSPFPSYTFTGPDLSSDPRAAIVLEDHYFTRSDAAVVFKRVDRASGQERYLYHGNDGTSMPWNDTAQLNYLLPEVREAVIQTILQVARQFPVIRFDAAMTLTRTHYQRLWFPLPGSGGDIPSRAEHGMSREQFDALMPREFWRDVVDRVAQEAPDTLLLAEAFWLLEGYFVRTLGMHRVYNSAFMNMLRDELNAEYRQLIKNTLEFDPQILKRYVNFMSNPDERTAIDQFSTGDKYFGVCTMLATLPGLPMFGHGQFEGFTERYGMEYRRAYLDESPNLDLVQRHEREIVPLLHRRALFAEVAAFRLYDFFTPDGAVDENVFAYSNRAGDDCALVIYHNRYAETRGWVRAAAATLESGPGGERRLAHHDLGEGLALHPDEGRFCILRDHVSGLEYLRSSRQLCEQGLYVELGAYQHLVFLDVREVADTSDRRYARLAAALDGRGVPSLDTALRDLVLEGVRAPLRALLSAPLARDLAAAPAHSSAEAEAALLDRVSAPLGALLHEASVLAEVGVDEPACVAGARVRLHAALTSEVLRHPDAPARRLPDADPLVWASLLGWIALDTLAHALGEDRAPERARRRLDDWKLGEVIAAALRDLDADEASAWRRVALITALLAHSRWDACLTDAPRAAADASLAHAVESWMRDPHAQQFLQVHDYAGTRWFNHEAFQEYLGWLRLVAELRLAAEPGDSPDADAARRARRERALRDLVRAEAASGYRVEALLQAARDAGAAPRPRGARPHDAPPRTPGAGSPAPARGRRRSNGSSPR